jgi:hypothetical protein
MLDGLDDHAGLLGLSDGRSDHTRDLVTVATDGDDGPVQAPGAAVPVLVVQPREELQLARDTPAAWRPDRSVP